MKNTALDQTFSALAHAGRRKMLDLLSEAPGMSVKALAAHFDMSRVGVIKHLRVLEDAQLVLSRKEGRTRRLFFNSVPIQQIYDRWTDEYSSFWASRMMDIKGRLEAQNEESGSA